MDTEQAELTEQEIQPDPSISEDIPKADKDIKGILSDALEVEKSGTTQVPQTTSEPVEAEQLQQQAVAPFLEITLPDGKKIPIANEDDFIKLLEGNQVLKDGWLRQADYTRKAQEVASQRKEIEQRIQEEEKSWGGAKPDAQSMKALSSVWQQYANGDPLVQDAIQKFVTDVHLIAKGKDPVGPMREMLGVSQSTTPSQVSPEIQGMRAEMARLNRELQGFKAQTTQERQLQFQKQAEAHRMEAEKTVDSWLTEKQKGGTKVGQEELMAMADLMSILDEKGQPKLTLDEAHNMALAKLGKLQGSVAKQVLSDSKAAKKRSPLAPSSRASAESEPEAKNIKDILRQGMKSLNPE